MEGLRTMTGLVDTTEMYVRTVYELEEEGIEPIRARICERLDLRGTSVRQTVDRLVGRELLILHDDRRLSLTDKGRLLAVRVMRKHRLAERLLIDVVGVPLEAAHAEACRWEHVMSERVERRLVTLLGNPADSPFGAPIPGLRELGVDSEERSFLDGVRRLTTATYRATDGLTLTVRRISEQPQQDTRLIGQLIDAGILPGREILATRRDNHVVVAAGGHELRLTLKVAQHIFVAA